MLWLRTMSKSGEMVEESQEARLERLGRQRPDAFKTIWMEIGFCFSIVMSQVLNEYFVSGFNIIIPTIVDALSIPPAATTWPASAFSLTVCSFLLPFGRLADIYGAFPIFLAGYAWLLVWSIIAGFSQNELMLDFSRALQGVGSAAFLPAGLTLLGKMYRPGRRKNLIFSIYGGMAALGFYIGIFFAGVTAQYTTWRWYFFIGTILTAITLVVAYFTIPADHKNRSSTLTMDWLGTILIPSATILIVFAITDSSHASGGWSAPYIPVTMAVGVCLLGVAIYVEGWVAQDPLIPPGLFRIKHMVPFIAGLIPIYSCLGIFLLYVTLYCQNVLKVQPMLLVAWFTPMGLGGCILSICGGLILHKVPGTILACVSGLAIIVNSVLFAEAPVDGSYWAWYFSAFICATLAIDLIFNVANVFFTSALLSREQGLAGALANVLLQLAIALGLGFSDIIASATAHQGLSQSYKNVFWFECSLGGISLIIFACFVRIGSAKSALTADESQEQQQVEESRS